MATGNAGSDWEQTAPRRAIISSPAPASATPSALRARIENGLIIVGLIAQLLFLGHHVYSDADVRYQSLTTLLTQGKFDQSKFSLIGPLFSTPIWYLGRLVHLPHNGVGLYNWAVFTLGIGALYWLLKDHLDRRLLRTFLLLLIAASMFPFHITNYFGEVFTAVLVAVGTIAAQTRRPVLGWTLVAIGVANTPATLVALGFLVVVRTFQTKRLQSLLPVFAAAALILGENWIRRGSPFASNYESGFGPPFFGLMAILFSFGKGLIFFVPGIFLPIRRILAGLPPAIGRLLGTTQAMWLAFVAGLVVVYSGWWAWNGGWFWGPRFFLFACFPAALALALAIHSAGQRLAVDIATFVVLALSVWGDVNGAVYGDASLFTFCTSNHSANGFLCDFVPNYSVLWYPVATLQPLTLLSIAYILYAVVVFVYLALPLARAIIADSVALVGPYVKEYWDAWRPGVSR